MVSTPPYSSFVRRVSPLLRCRCGPGGQHQNYAHSPPPLHTYHMPYPPHPLLFDHLNNIWWCTQIMKPCIMQFSPSVCHLPPLISSAPHSRAPLFCARGFQIILSYSSPSTRYRLLSEDTLELTFVWLLALRSAAVCSLQVRTDWDVSWRCYWR